MGSYPEHERRDLKDPVLINELISSLKGSKVLTPDSDGYAEGIKRWSEASEKPAGAIVLATSAVDVSSAVLFSKAWSLDLAVRGGGHSCSGASSSDGGLVIDLSTMRGVKVDPSKMTITAQGGCVWEDVDKAAGEYGLATVGGTVNHTGIGGLTLGGGYGWLSGQYGLVIDNLLSVQIVLADGSIVTASKTENTELFWAICGAGHSFGVVTEFTYKAHEQKTPVWAGILAFPPEKAEELTTIANQLLESSSGNSGMIIGFTTAPPTFQPLLISAIYFNGPPSTAEPFFAPLLTLNPLMNLTNQIPYPTLNSILNNAAHHGGRKTSKGSTFTTPLRPTFFSTLFQEYIQFCARVPSASATCLFEFLPTSTICSQDPSASAFAGRGNHQNALVSPKWTDPTDDAECRAWAREMAGKFAEERERKVRDREVGGETPEVTEYGNYDGLEEKASMIFGKNLERLVALKRRFDPGNRFSKGHLQIS